MSLVQTFCAYDVSLSFVQRSSHLIFTPFFNRHFFYIHFLVLLSALYLPLFAIDTAYAAGWGEETYIGLDVLNGVIVFLQCIFVVGLRSLGSKMIDPYGDDLEDLSVINYVEGTLEICSTIMNSKQPSKRSSKSMTSP